MAGSIGEWYRMRDELTELRRKLDEEMNELAGEIHNIERQAKAIAKAIKTTTDPGAKENLRREKAELHRRWNLLNRRFDNIYDRWFVAGDDIDALNELINNLFAGLGGFGLGGLAGAGGASDFGNWLSGSGGGGSERRPPRGPGLAARSAWFARYVNSLFRRWDRLRFLSPRCSRTGGILSWWLNRLG